MNRFFIGTNVFIYARGKDHPHKEACARLILKIADGSFAREWGEPVTDAEVFQELLYRYTMIGRWETGVQLYRDILELGMRVAPVDTHALNILLDRAPDFFRAGLSPRDMVHAGVMLAGGIRRIVSHDADFDRVPDLERMEPAVFFQDA